MTPRVKVWFDESAASSLTALLPRSIGERHGELSLLNVSGLRDAEIVVGQPEPEKILDAPNVRWVHLTAAGFTAYDRDENRRRFNSRGTAVTNSSSVYADPCAQYILGMMLSFNRGIFSAYRLQLGDREWLQWELRRRASVLAGQTILLLGYGAIGRRIAELLHPFGVRIFALRRSESTGSETVRFIRAAELSRVLETADHVVNVLPLNEGTLGFMNADRIGRIKNGAAFYNIGRGATVDQDALEQELKTGRIFAFLDVTTPEPLPRDHSLWRAAQCHITPHIAGGIHDEPERLIRHFTFNLDRFLDDLPLVDRVL